MRMSGRLVALTVFVGLALAALPFSSRVTAGETAETEKEEVSEEVKRDLGPEGARPGILADRPVEVYVNGERKGEFTKSDLGSLTWKKVFSPRGPRKGWSVVDVMKAKGITHAKEVRFINRKGKQIVVPWKRLLQAKDTPVFSYNFNGELIVMSDVSDKIPDHLRDAQEDKLRDEMHKARKRSLIFFRGVTRIELLT